MSFLLLDIPRKLASVQLFGSLVSCYRVLLTVTVRETEFSKNRRMAGLVEAFCIRMLPETGIPFLLARCGEFGIDVPDEKIADKPYLLKLVMRHLTSDTVENSADQGVALFLKLYNDLGGELQAIGAQFKRESNLPPMEGEDGVARGRIDGVESLSYHKLRQFKINGTIGDPGQKNCVSFSSLCFQIKQGEKQGYSIGEIYTGIIRAIEAGNPFRDVLELEAEDFDRDALLKSLRSHFMERDPNTVFNELRTAVQGPNETAHKFCCRCVALKKRVLMMYAAESVAFDEQNLISTFFRTMSTGLRQSNIRNELRQVFRDADISDDDLLVEVSLAQANEEERLKKMGEKGKNASINKLTCGDDSSDEFERASDASSACFSSASEPSQNPGKGGRRNNAKSAKNSKQKAQNQTQNTQNADTFLMAEVGKMAAAMEKLSTSNAALTAEVNVLKQLAAKNHTAGPRAPPQNNGNVLIGNPTLGQNNGNSNLSATAPVFSYGNNVPTPTAPLFSRPQMRRNRNNRPVYLCQNCIATQSSYCRHCFKCGRDDHKANECPEN